MILRTIAFVLGCALLVSCGADDPGTASAGLGAAGDRAASPAEMPARDTARPPPSSEPEPDARILTPDGWGPLRIGMSRAEVVAAAGEDAAPAAVGGPDPAQCDEFRPADAPAGMLVMIERGVLTRISVSRNRDIATPEGFRVGDAGAAVQAEYGDRARVEPHQYQAPPARYLTVWRDSASGAARRGLRYEIDAAGIVVHMRAGGPSIEHAEGCV